ncbi:MAG TPA: serine/threonine-protein kinase, partial [Solirubrobacteraceae bacterium]|nr:serine/threonine-protein kinase [Solirubrobacteraceae bacterium]
MDATEDRRLAGQDGLLAGRYRLGRRLGSGGFGTVYAAHDARLDREVALKLIPAHGPAPERAQREALAAARLHHPGIVAVFDAGDDPEGRYLVSELVHGRTLDALERDGALSDRDVLRVGLALAEALGHAHERGVIHRDVKPQNVIVPDEPDGARAKLTDFGVAHLAGDAPLTRTGDVVGTLAYMAPEQAAGERVDERADLYSLALVLYEALAGSNPVRGASPAATARLVGTALPPLRGRRRDLPAPLCAAIDQALAPAADDRGGLGDLADALAAALPEVSDDGGTIAPHPLERAPSRLPPLGRLAAGLAAGGLTALALAAADPPRWAGATGGDLVVTPLAGAAIAGLLVALFPRLGWLAAAAGCI